jgi:hypothetical protein
MKVFVNGPNFLHSSFFACVNQTLSCILIYLISQSLITDQNTTNEAWKYYTGGRISVHKKTGQNWFGEHRKDSLEI